jgi:hypothetical protein
MPVYKYSVANAVLHLFAGSTNRQRQELLRIFDFLSNEPFSEGDTTQSDHAGRRCQVKRFGPWTVTYWSEHLVKEIHILDVQRLEQ